MSIIEKSPYFMMFLLFNSGDIISPVRDRQI